MADLFPSLKIDLQPAASESPNWLAGFPQHTQRLKPMVGVLERLKTSALGLTEHVAAVRDLASWVEFLFQAPAPLESYAELHCTHRGTRSNCVTIELYFQVCVRARALQLRCTCRQTLHLSQRFALLAHCGQSGTTWLFPKARPTPDAIYRERIEFVRRLVGLQTYTLSVLRDRMTDRPYALRQLIDATELEDYYRYTRAYGFWITLHLTLKDRHCSDPNAPVPVSVEQAPEHTQSLGHALQAALECQRTLAEIQTDAFVIGGMCTVPLMRPLDLDDKRRKRPDATQPPLAVDARWETLVAPMVLALRAEWAHCCATPDVRPQPPPPPPPPLHAQESGICSYLVQQLLRYGFDHPSRCKWDPSANRMIGIGLPDRFPAAGVVTQLLKAAEGMPGTLLTGAPIR
jgi:hypothetical protein